MNAYLTMQYRCSNRLLGMLLLMTIENISRCRQRQQPIRRTTGTYHHSLAYCERWTTVTIEQNIMKATRPDGGSTGGYDVLSWQQKGIGITRIAFGVAWAVAAILKWQPAFISSFTDTVNG